MGESYRQRLAVLVVEDEPQIRLAIVCDLQDAGFEAFEAHDAAEAIKILVRNRHISLVFTDVDLMSGISGLELAAIVRGRWPAIRIIVTSGIHNVSSDAIPTKSRFIPKPYSPTDVIALISEMVGT